MLRFHLSFPDDDIGSLDRHFLGGVNLNFEFSELLIIVVIVILAVLGFATYKFKKGTKSREAGMQFLGMGIVWILFGLGYSLWRGGNPFEIGLFNLGLIFALAGSLQLFIGRFNQNHLDT